MSNSKLYCTMSDVESIIGWSFGAQRELCEEIDIKPIRGRKDGSKVQFGYTKEQFEALLKRGNYVTVHRGGEKFLVNKKKLKDHIDNGLY